MDPQKESDQLPEEQPAGAVPDDTGKESRDEAKDNAGGADDDGKASGQATGNPKNAG